MAYKTILVHLNDERRARHLLDHAVALARSRGAHLIGLHVFPAYHLRPPVSFGIGTSLLGDLKRRIREESDRLKAAFDMATANEPFTAEWRSISAQAGDPAAMVMSHGVTTDLIVASQADPSWDMSRLLDCTDRLAIEGGRPIFAVPNGEWTAAIPPKRITVGWKACREAARAVWDALPFLQNADDVQLLTVDEGEHTDHGVPPAAIADALRRHGVKVAVSQTTAGKLSSGETLWEHVLQHNSDLLVMGAYGHSRLRELVLGGVTRHVLTRTTIPVLLSH